MSMCLRRSAPSYGEATSPGARTYYVEQRDRGLDHDAALRALSNRLVGILHGCLKTRTLCDEATAWSHGVKLPAAARQSKSRGVSADPGGPDGEGQARGQALDARGEPLEQPPGTGQDRPTRRLDIE